MYDEKQRAETSITIRIMNNVKHTHRYIYNYHVYLFIRLDGFLHLFIHHQKENDNFFRIIVELY